MEREEEKQNDKGKRPIHHREDFDYFEMIRLCDFFVFDMFFVLVRWCSTFVKKVLFEKKSTF